MWMDTGEPGFTPGVRPIASLTQVAFGSVVDAKEAFFTSMMQSAWAAVFSN